MSLIKKITSQGKLFDYSKGGLEYILGNPQALKERFPNGYLTSWPKIRQILGIKEENPSLEILSLAYVRNSWLISELYPSI